LSDWFLALDLQLDAEVVRTEDVHDRSLGVLSRDDRDRKPPWIRVDAGSQPVRQTLNLVLMPHPKTEQGHDGELGRSQQNQHVRSSLSNLPRSEHRSAERQLGVLATDHQLDGEVVRPEERDELVLGVLSRENRDGGHPGKRADDGSVLVHQSVDLRRRPDRITQLGHDRELLPSLTSLHVQSDQIHGFLHRCSTGSIAITITYFLMFVNRNHMDTYLF